MLENSDDFVFDNQMIAQAVMFGFRIGEISCPTKYFKDASSINFKRSVQYGLGVLAYNSQFCRPQDGNSPLVALRGHRKKNRPALLRPHRIRMPSS